MKYPPFILLFALTLLPINRAMASQAYGSINNFDVVNDTGTNCHGFEIELDGIHSKDITYTYDWNHYGTPVITEDNTDTNNPKVFVEYKAVYTNNAWSAFTAVPAAPIAPTMGHQFTDPSTNFGGEHFGVGYSGVPTNILYNWLQDNGSGSLILGPAVSVATPVFNYAPAAGGAPAQVQAVIVPPPPPVPEVVPLEFGNATWVKEIRTTTHTNNPVELRDLASPDTNFPTMNNWAAGEPAEVESEWNILQTDTGNTNGANNELAGAAEPLDNGDEVVTRRYEFYKYTGPLDPETGEALADSVGPDGTNGVGKYSNTPVVGDFLGTQMAAVDPAGHLGLIDHLPDGEVGTQYADRTVVIPGTAPFTSVLTNGALPAGLSYDAVAGVISGTPTTNGDFPFTITATDGVDPDVSNNYILTIAPAGVVPPAQSIIQGVAVPAGAGVVEVVDPKIAIPNVLGTNLPNIYYSNIAKLSNGKTATVKVTPKAGYKFVGWSEAGILLTNSTNYTFPVQANHKVVALFTNAPVVGTNPQTITFPAIPTQRVTNVTVTLNATASSGNVVSYAVTGPATLSSSNIVTLTNSGVVSVTASQGGGNGYKAAKPVKRIFAVLKSAQKITATKIPTHPLSDGTVTIVATSNSTNPLIYTLKTPKTASLLENVLTLKTPGVVTVQVKQAASPAYTAAVPVTLSFRVTR